MKVLNFQYLRTMYVPFIYQDIWTETLFQQTLSVLWKCSWQEICYLYSNCNNFITSFHISKKMTAQIREYSMVHGNKKGAAFCNSAPIMLALLHGISSASWSVLLPVTNILCSRWCISCFVSSTSTYSHSHKLVATMCMKPKRCNSLKLPDSISLLVRNMNCICANVRVIRKAGVITDTTLRHLFVISKYSPSSRPLYTIEPIPNAVKEEKFREKKYSKTYTITTF